MSDSAVNDHGLTKSVSARLATLKSSTPEVSRSFSDLGRAATANGVLDKKTEELIAPATERSGWSFRLRAGSTSSP